MPDSQVTIGINITVAQMYGSYFVLFMLFALERYIWPNKRSAITGSGPKPTSNGASKPKNA